MLLLLLLLPLPGWPAGQLTELCRLVVPTDGCWRPEGCRHLTLGGERDWDLGSVGLGGKDVGCAWLWLYFFLPHAQCVAYEKLQRTHGCAACGFSSNISNRLSFAVVLAA
jgi:hypothetical protein